MDYLQRYLAGRPGDLDQRERFAKLMVKMAKYPKHYEECMIVLEDLLRRDPDRDELRRFVVDFAIAKAGLPNEAKVHLDILMAKYPNDGSLEEQYAAIKFFERNYEAAAALYAAAYDHKPDLINAYIGRAFLLRQHLADPGSADAAMAQMARANDANFKAHLVYADYARKYYPDKPDLANVELVKARKLAPDELDVIIFGSELSRAEAQRLRRSSNTVALADAKLAEARAELDRGRKLHPKSVAIHRSRAALEIGESDQPAAIRVLNEGLAELPENVELLLALVDSRIETGDRSGAEANLATLQKLDHPTNRAAYERGRLLMLDGAWLEAARILDTVRINAGEDHGLARSANLMLGRCYEQIGETDRRLEAFARSIPDDIHDPLWSSALRGQAEAYAALGKPDDALRTYQKLAEHYPAIGVRIAKLHLLMELRKPEADRVWSPVRVALDRAVAAAPSLDESTEVQLLRADLLMFQKSDAESRKIVETLFANRPKELPVWVAKAARAYKDSGAVAAVEILEKGRRQLDDPVDLRVAQGLYAADPKDPSAEEKLTKLSEGIEKYTVPARRLLLSKLAESATLAGKDALAGRFWDAVVSVQPDDLAAQLHRFDRNLRAGDEPALARVQKEIERIDGHGGVSAKVSRAHFSMWKARKTESAADLTEAFTLLEDVERIRPDWSRISLSKAVILDRQGKTDAALTAYQTAVDQGENDPIILRRLIELHASKGHFARADEILNRIPADDSAGPDALRLAAEISMRVDSGPRALKFAAKAVPADSKKPDDWAWLGRLRWQAGDREGARAAFQKAVDLDASAPGAWLQLINFLAVNNGKDFEDATEKIESAKTRVPEKDLAIFLAQSYALVARYDLAQKQFQKARTEQPNNARVLLAEAEFLTARQQWSSARDAWERVLTSGTAPGDQAFARQRFAICFAADPDYAISKRAVELLGMDSGGALKKPVENETTEQRRTRALALAMQRDRESKIAAIALLEGDRATLASGDQFLLAKVYNQVGDRKNVRTTMSDLLKTSDKDPFYAAFLTFYTLWLTELKDYDEAALWMTKLEKREPDTLRSAELNIRILAGQQKLPDARVALQKEASKTDAPSGKLAQVAQAAGLLPEAEELWKKYVAANVEKSPEAVLALAQFYGRNNRLQEALDLCEKASATCSPLTVAQVSVGILIGAKPDGAKEAVARVSKMIEDAIRTKGLLESAVQPELAYLRNLAEDYASSIAIFRQQAAERPNPTIPQKNARALALNNLAYLLGLKERKHDEALIHIRTARGLVGDLPELLDTEALILLDRGGMKDLDDARPLLEGLVASTSSAQAYFHLAILENKQGKREEHQIAWTEAKRLGLKLQSLHPLESAYFDRFSHDAR